MPILFSDVYFILKWDIEYKNDFSIVIQGYLDAGTTLGVLCKEVALAVLHCVEQLDDSTPQINLVQ